MLYHSKNKYKNWLKITSEEYLAPIFKWSYIISQHPGSPCQEIRQYKEMMAESEEHTHLYYQSLYQKGYSDCWASRRCQQQCKSIGISEMFAPYYCPTPKKHQLHLQLKEIFLNFIPPFLPPNQWNTIESYIKEMLKMTWRKGSWCTQCCVCPMPIILLTWKSCIYSFKPGVSTTTTLHSHISPMIHPTYLLMDNLHHRIKQDPEMSTLEKNSIIAYLLLLLLPGTSFCKKTRSEETRKCHQA